MKTLIEKRRDAGRRGGQQTLARHGVQHFKTIGAKGAKVFHSRYELVPVGLSQFAIVHRETGNVTAYLDGKPF